MGNPDPEVDPARGQLAVKSLPARLVEVPNSEDDDDPLPVGITSAATLHTEPDNAAHHGAILSPHKVALHACDTVAMRLFSTAGVLSNGDREHVQAADQQKTSTMPRQAALQGILHPWMALRQLRPQLVLGRALFCDKAAVWNLTSTRAP